MIGGAKGIGIGIDFGIPNQYCRATSKPYIEKDVLDSLRVVASAYGKSNDDPDRAVVKNLVDPDNPFVISNAAFKLNSGFGKYSADFESFDWAVNISQKQHNKATISLNGRLCNHAAIEVDEMKVNIIGNVTELIYWYIANPDDTTRSEIRLTSGINTLPKSYAKDDGQTYNIGFAYISGDSEITIEQIPSFEGAFVTDGIDDLITSTKTVQEMLGGSNEITVVSMIHQIDGNVNYTNGYTNYIRHGGGFIRNSVTGINGKGFNKTGIYGYTSTQLDSSNMGLGNVINNILGDKDDYSFERSSTYTLDDAKYSVQNFVNANNQPSNEGSSVAWYWTIIANKVLTTDQINQVIAYFNLDRTLKSDIYCNIAKQGITNENHTEFGDKLIDFSGNGRDIQLNNLAWDGDSGIGKYNYPNWKVTATIANTYSTIVNYPTVNGTYSINVNGVSELMQSIGLHLEIKYTTSTGIIYNDIKQDGVYSYILPDGATDLTLRFGGIPGIVNEPCNITITQIPSHAGALCLDGVNDFGQFVGDLELKDYTFIADRAYSRIAPSQVPFIASTQTNGQAPFLMEYLNEDTYVYPHSFGTTTKTTNLNIQRQISYQSTYVYNGNSISKGTSVDTGDGLTIGNSGSTGLQYSPLCLWSLMLFPYSMSEFLIERQLKKHKLGTLYPDMVEFRPVIKQDNRIKSIKYYIDGKTANIGQYYPIGTGLGIAVETVQPYMVKSLKVNGVNTIPNADYKGFNARLDSKSPQKITMDIQVNSSLVQWNPVVESNAEYKVVDCYIDTLPAVVGNYYPINSKLRIAVTTKGAADEVTSLTVNGVSLGTPSVDGNRFSFNGTLSDKSPQKINITIDEYIRYEDIVQPYPVLLRFNDENGNEVSWGGKFRVGSTITRIGSIADPESNLLNGLYSVSGLSLNGKAVTSSTSIVEKQMVFKTTATWLLDNSKPKCILSPRLLRIPNSSYKILGYIPDISGHGNHGKINNSAYAGASGANGYLQNFSGWTKASGVSSTDSVISSSNNLVAANGWIAYVTSGTVIPTFKVEISGIPVNGNLRFEGSDQTLVNGVNTIQGITTTKVTGFYISSGYDNDWSNLKIEQIGEYEGAYCFDGVDDFVTIPTLSSGGKQVLMKVNWQKYGAILYDQRGNNDEFAIYVYDEVQENIAYNGRNNGKTYIDGILNKYIKSSELKGILHDITITNPLSLGISKKMPTIGTNSNYNGFFSQMALYDFMLFDNISTDDKIKELNEYVGIEAKVELPPYYWDAYGKTNLDVDKTTIQQRGVAEGDYDLTNNNLAYDKMSGYGGYEFAKFDNTSEWNLIRNSTGIEVVSRNGYSCTLKRVGSNVWDFGNSSNRKIGKDLNFNIKCDKNIKIKWQLKYKTTENPDTEITVELVNDSIGPNPKSITLPHKTDEELTTLGAIESSVYYLVYFDSSTLPIGEEYTVEMLPLYPNGLVYDGVTDYSENANIPALTDFTYVFKRKLLDNVAGCASMTKGLTDQQRAVVIDYINTTGGINGTSFGNMAFVPSLRDSDIIYSTTTNINGTTITKGNNPDSNGIDIGKFATYYKKMVFYKLILYPKTIPLLQINFLKNLMERDEIIDLNNKIFIQE